MILLERHDAVEIRADSNALEELLPELKKQRPNYITLLIKPEDLDFNLVQQVLSGRFEIATEPSWRQRFENHPAQHNVEIGHDRKRDALWRPLFSPD